MAPGFPIAVGDVVVRTSEALYQAMRFPGRPDFQRRVLDQLSPMAAKMVCKPIRDQHTRPDWLAVRVAVMRWCLRAKLVSNFDTFAALLVSTGRVPIVEDSVKDDFWGARAFNTEMLSGSNVLGRLLMELREQVFDGQIVRPMRLEPLSIPRFELLGEPIGVLDEPITIMSEEPASAEALESASGRLFEVE